MKSIGQAKSIPLSDLIDILVKIERKGIKYVDIELIRDTLGDRLRVTKGKKVSKVSTKVPLTDARLLTLLKYV